MLSLLQRSALFFTPMNAFEDPFEGVYPQITNARIMWEEIQRLLVKLRGIPNEVGIVNGEVLRLVDQCVLDSQHDLDSPITEFNQTAEELTSLFKQNFFVNCWHQNSSESAGMWKLYAGQRGIAIQTTVGRFKQCFAVENKMDVCIGRVRYVEDECWSDPRRFLELKRMKHARDDPKFWAFLKRRCFAHEQEVRACTFGDEDVSSVGVYVKVDLHSLIEKIYISPDAPHWVADVVKTELMSRGIAVPVRSSSVYQKP